MIRKTSETRALAGNIVNAYNDSQTSAYSTEYVNGCNTYSTTEVNTGKKWIDGKPIYRKVIFSNSLAIGVATGVSNIEKLWFAQSFFYWNDDYIYDNSEIKLYWNKTNNTILGSGSNLTNYKGYITIEYTKTTD